MMTHLTTTVNMWTRVCKGSLQFPNFFQTWRFFPHAKLLLSYTCNLNNQVSRDKLCIYIIYCLPPTHPQLSGDHYHKILKLCKTLDKKAFWKAINVILYISCKMIVHWFAKGNHCPKCASCCVMSLLQATSVPSFVTFECSFSGMLASSYLPCNCLQDVHSFSSHFDLGMKKQTSFPNDEKQPKPQSPIQT